MRCEVYRLVSLRLVCQRFRIGRLLLLVQLFGKVIKPIILFLRVLLCHLSIILRMLHLNLHSILNSTPIRLCKGLFEGAEMVTLTNGEHGVVCQ